MIVNIRWKRWLEYVGVIFFIFHFSLFISSCSDDDSEDVNEFDNWVEQNDAVLSQWASNSSYQKFKSYTKDQVAVGKNSDYVYVRVVESGIGTEKPLFSDTIRGSCYCMPLIQVWMFSNTMSARRSMDSTVSNPTCGVQIRFGAPRKECPSGSGGSFSYTSVPYRICPLWIASATASVLTTGPREVLIRIAPGFITAISSLPIRSRVWGVSGV